jgi:hypothetical protein
VLPAGTEEGVSFFVVSCGSTGTAALVCVWANVEIRKTDAKQKIDAKKIIPIYRIRLFKNLMDG